MPTAETVVDVADDRRWTLRPNDGVLAWWIFIEDPFTHFTNFSDPNWVAAWQGADSTLDGFTCPQAMVRDMKTIVATVKGAHVYVRGIFWVGNPGVDGISPGNWGNASQNVGGQQFQQRTAAFGYWDMTGG